MLITLFGAAGDEVTGSAYLLQTDAANVMLDCDLFQGAQKLENWNRPPEESRVAPLDAVILPHAHVDHTGRLPFFTHGDDSQQRTLRGLTQKNFGLQAETTDCLATIEARRHSIGRG